MVLEASDLRRQDTGGERSPKDFVRKIHVCFDDHAYFMCLLREIELYANVFGCSVVCKW